MRYFDYAATTPMSERALTAYQEAARNYYGNTSSLHDIGSSAQEILEKCRAVLASFLQAEAEGVYFTSGGSEANALVIQSVVYARKQQGRHLITTEVEHASVRNVFRMLEREGFDVTYVKPDFEGKIQVEDIKEALQDDTIFASIQHVNSEIGTIQDLQAIGSILRENNVFFHSDCVQSFGKLPIDVKEMNVDAVSLSGHKIYGPKGVGACYINPAHKWVSLIPGTTHEKGFKPGTVDVPGIASFVTASEEIVEEMEEEARRMNRLRERFLTFLKEAVSEVVVEGSYEHQLPHICGLRIHGIEGQYVMLECNKRGAAVSTGSACSIGKTTPSQTMTATGKSKQEAKELFRISFGRQTTDADVDFLVSALLGTIRQYTA
ncbi:IscS subfamily cysteine desulfurase [Bacillus tianshenii]|nr:IscS subfamily cysteine desulfurase [Bacillus tianshenii]